MLLHRLRHKKKKPTIAPAARLAAGRLTSLINSMADGVLAVDKDINIVIYNGAALNILDRNDAVQGRPLAGIFNPIDKEGKPVNVNQLIESAQVSTTNRDLLLKYSDGSTVNLYLNIAPVNLGYGTGGKQGYVIIMRDITREKSLEEERDEFISVASHELRTPIAITEGNISNAQFIAEKSGDMKQVKAALDQAHTQILFLADLVNDLSTLSRAERGVLTVQTEPIDINELLIDLVHNYEEQAKSKGLTLTYSVNPNVTEPLLSSKLYVREMLQNFITNALRYTEQGSITLTAEKTTEGVKLAVTDTGIGISHSDQQRVFEKFFRSEDYRTRKTNGTGLGLYVTAKLARLLNATITLQSELNKGSTFAVTVPNFVKPEKQA